MSSGVSGQLRGLIVGVGSAATLALAAYIAWPGSEPSIQMGDADANGSDSVADAGPQSADETADLARRRRVRTSAALPGSADAGSGEAAFEGLDPFGPDAGETAFEELDPFGPDAESEFLEFGHSPEALRPQEAIDRPVRQLREGREREAAQSGDENAEDGAGADRSDDPAFGSRLVGPVFVLPKDPSTLGDLEPAPTPEVLDTLRESMEEPPSLEELGVEDPEMPSEDEYNAMLAAAQEPLDAETERRLREQLEQHVIEPETLIHLEDVKAGQEILVCDYFGC